MNRTAAHTELVKRVRVALGGEPDFTLWHNYVAVVEDVRGFSVRVGLAIGSADLIGVLGPWGRLVGLECKTGRAVLSDDQKLWHALAASRGAFVAVVHSVEEARAALEMARAEARSRVA